jgi:hypothetical protein
VQESLLSTTIPGAVQESVLSTVPGSVNLSSNLHCDPAGSNISRITVGINYPEDHPDAISIVSGLLRITEIAKDHSGTHHITPAQPIQKLVTNSITLVDPGMISQFQKSLPQLI